MFWIQLLILIFILLLGARFSGVFFGMAGAIGLLILSIFFHTAPTSPPIDVLLIITSVVLAASTMQQCGGMTILVKFAEKLLKRNPNHIIFLAPALSWLFTFMAGTGNVLFNILPVIAEVAKDAGVRPERPISVSVIASQHGVVASPISAATVALAAILAPFNITLFQILALSVPATLIGLAISAFFMLHHGKDLDVDEEYLELLKDPKYKQQAEVNANLTPITSLSKYSVIIFLISAVLVVFMGTVSWLRPEVVNAAGKIYHVSMSNMIELVMMAAAGLMVIVCRPNVDGIVNTGVFKAGMMGVVTIFGLSWMADSFVSQNLTIIKEATASMAEAGPYIFAVAMFIASIFLDSQGATVASLVPVGVQMGLDPMFLAAIFPAVCGYYVIPNNGVMLAGVAFDTTGTTKIGKWAINHSYMLPGTIATVGAVIVGILLYTIFY